MGAYKIKWHQSARSELKAIYEYYLPETVQGAENIVEDILKAVDKLAEEPEVNYATEPHLGHPYQYIKTRRYKIIHKKQNNEIRILGIFDTKQDPQKLKKIKKRE